LSKPLIRRAWAIVVAAVALAVLAGCEPAEPVANVESGAKKIAVFEGGEVTQSELQEQLDLLAQQSGGVEITPDSPQYDAAVQQVMPQLLGLEISEAYAREHGITVTEEDVDEEFAKIKEQVGRETAAQAEAAGQENVSVEEGFQLALEQAGYTEEQLREDIRTNLPIQEVQERVVGDVEPSEEEVQKYYEENKGLQFTTPAERCVRHILFNKDQKEKAEEVKARLEDGADFAELAEEFSQDPASAESGGDLGCIGRGETVPAFEEAAFDAEEGKIVGPVETEFGFHLIRVDEVHEESVTPLEDVAPQIKDQLRGEQQAQEFDAWIQDQIEKRDVKYLPGYAPPEQQTGE
jgi:peptidyl-prolyl cis-trans isomerase C